MISSERNAGESNTPITDDELELFAASSGSEQFVIDESILDGDGVSQDYINECKSAARPYLSLDYHNFPRDRDGTTYKFFEGENLEHEDTRNAINNPLRLIRPKVLSSPSQMVYYGISTYTQTPSNYASSRSERGFRDVEFEQLYAKGVESFNSLYISVLESTNLSLEDERQTHVQKQLDDIFGDTKIGAVSFKSKIKEGLKDETPAGWLTHAVLSVILNPSEEVLPAARVRALGLLKAYSADEIYNGFTSGSKDGLGNSYYGSGLISCGVKERLPFTMTSAEDRHKDEHTDWSKNPILASLSEQVQIGDYRSAANAIVSRPEEAIQLSMLTLRIYGKEKFGLSFLREIPDLDSKTQAIMFGPRATFYIDNKISNKLEDQVSEGAGTQFDPTLGFDDLTASMIESSSSAELKRILGAALLRLRASEELAASLAVKANRSAGHKFGRKDPDNFCGVLGLSPDILDQYNDTEIRTILNGAARTMSKLTHPDLGGPDNYEARNKMTEDINYARDALLDSDFRKNYGK